MRFKHTIMLSMACTLTSFAPAQGLDVWLGTARSKLSQGIYHCTLDDRRGTLSEPTLAATIEGPGFLAMHPKLAVLYAVGVLDEAPVVAAYRIVKSKDRAAALEWINASPIGDGQAAHLAIDRTGTTLLTVQYGGGSVATFSLADDGSVRARSALIEHDESSGVVARRQDAPHPHWVGFSPDNRFVFVPDLGADKIMVYGFDAGQGRLTPTGFGSAPSGSGPRHMKFHPNGKWVYVLNELALSVTIYDYDAVNGKLTRRQTVPTLEASVLAKEKFASASEIRIHPNGRILFTANRGHDSITAFRIDAASGELSRTESEHCRGATPRNFNVSPSGKWLLAAGQHSHTLAAFEIDALHGELSYNRSIVFAPSAICVLFGAAR